MCWDLIPTKAFLSLSMKSVCFPFQISYVVSRGLMLLQSSSGDFILFPSLQLLAMAQVPLRLYVKAPSCKCWMHVLIRQQLKQKSESFIFKINLSRGSPDLGSKKPGFRGWVIFISTLTLKYGLLSRPSGSMLPSTSFVKPMHLPKVRRFLGSYSLRAIHGFVPRIKLQKTLSHLKWSLGAIYIGSIDVPREMELVSIYFLYMKMFCKSPG